MVEDGSLRVLEILSRAASVIAEGEVHQLMTANDTATTEDDYLAVIEAKTAALFAAASRIGAVLAERPRGRREALERFGRNLGIAFQLVDDMLDFSARETELGKSGRRRFPRRQDHPADPPRLRPRRRRGARLLAAHARRRRAGSRATSNARCASLERRGALAETLARARVYAARGDRRARTVFPDGPQRRALIEAAAFATERGF